MQIKVFKAGNMKDAMTAMKDELGDDAIILHSKKYKEGGILGIGSREVVEITAAIEESSMPTKDEPPPLKHPTVAPNSLLTRYKTSGTAQAVEEAETAIRNEELGIRNDDAPVVEESKPVEEPPQIIQEEEPQNNFEAALQAAQVEETSPQIEAPSPQVEEPSQVQEPTQAEEPSQVQEPPQAEEPSQVEESQPQAEEPQPQAEEPSPQAEETPQVEEPSPQAEETPQVEEPQPQTEEPPQVQEPSQTEEPSPQAEEPSQAQGATFTQEQIAQTQAMIMAQFNQMQMMQQAAIAQAQAQAQAQMQAQQIQAQAAPDIQNEEKIKRLEAEIAQMKALLAEVLGRDPKKGSLTLHEAMKLQEVDEDVLTEMASQSNAGDTLVDVHTSAAKSTLINYLNEHVKFADGVKLNRHGVRIVALLGTTGVGKTTTLAKIAAKFVLEQRTNVALITADTYRISAVEQLKTYSDILELPLEIVYNPAELSAALERHRDKELILIDTAGRSQHNEYQMRELEEFLRVNPRIEKHLVISATTKLTDARQIMNKFLQVEPDKIIFTKTDETGSLGMIINLLRDSKYSLSYVTTGQSVPDDIERAGAEILTNLLLKKVDEM